jgi:hypothetical protein
VDSVLRPLEVVDEAEADGALTGIPSEVVEVAEEAVALVATSPSASC